MHAMHLGTNFGIAGLLQFHTLEDVLKYTPYLTTWDWCDGHNEDGIIVTAVLDGGDVVTLDTHKHSGWADNYIEDVDEEANSIGEQVADMKVSLLIFTEVRKGQNGYTEYEEYLFTPSLLTEKKCANA